MTLSDIQILVVDDVQTIRVQIKDILKLSGYEKIHSVSSGAEALETLKSGSYQCVLADWYMEPMSGLELLKQVRSDSKLKNIAFIMVTGEGTKERVVEAIRLGVDDYVVKPFTSDHAQLKIMNVLIKRKLI